MENETKWKEIFKKYPIGSSISGIVEQVRDFGFFLDIGEKPFIGLVRITNICDEPSKVYESFPSIGEKINGIVVWIDEYQISITIKPSHLYFSSKHQEIIKKYPIGATMRATVLYQEKDSIFLDIGEKQSLILGVLDAAAQKIAIPTHVSPGMVVECRVLSIEVYKPLTEMRMHLQFIKPV